MKPMLDSVGTVQAASVTGLSPGWPLGSLILLALAAVIAVIIYSFARPSDPGSPGITRSMLALVLVGGLMILAAASFAAGVDAQTRNLLLGGVVASASSAVAFYFASRSAESARRDVLNAALGAEVVPDLVGKTVSEAQAITSRGSLMLKLPDPAPAATDKVETQSHPAGTSALRGTVITVTAGP